MIIDDEDVARSHLRKLLEDFRTTVEIAGEASNGIEAVEMIERISPDVLFLDVQMPGLNGFEVVARLTKSPCIVFTTAYDEYALAAFRENTIDYLLKPISREDLERAITKLERTGPGRGDIRTIVEAVLSGMKQRALTRIKVQTGDRIIIVPVDTVKYFEADEKYTTVCAEGGTWVIDTPLAALEQQLPPRDFARIHRRHIVNVNYIVEFRKWFDRKLKCIVRGCETKEFIVSRSYVDRIKKLCE
jgi:two-component system LytT family response regulator